MRTSQLFRDALQIARRAERAARGLPPPRSADLPAIGRRHLLKLLGGTAAALSAPPAFGGRRAGSVAIVGGGLAGLNALRVLSEAGIEARLYEARRRLGGRVFTVADGLVPGIAVEMGGQFVNSDHADMIALAKRFGIGLVDRKALGGSEQIIADRRRIDPALIARELGPIAAQIARDSEALDAGFETAAPALDRLSVAAYLHRHRALIRSDIVRDLVVHTVRTEFGVEPDEASAIELIFNLPTVEGEAFETLGTSDERFMIEGGSARIVEALAAGQQGRIETGRPLVALRQAGDQVMLRFADGGTATADRVILTLPASVMGDVDHGGLFAAPWRALAAELRLGRNEKLNAAYARRVWEPAMGAGGSSWSCGAMPGFAEVWEASAGQPGTAGVLTWFFGGDQVGGMTRKTLRRAVEAETGEVMGDLAGASLDGMQLTRWQADRFARGAYVNFRPGQLTRFGGLLWLEENGVATQLAKSGPVLFAGEHLSDAWPGYMNGGAQTGRLAAQAILAGA